MRLNTIVCIQKLIDDEKTRKREAVKVLHETLTEKEKEAGVSSWQTAVNDEIKFYRNLIASKEKEIIDFNILIRDWDGKDWQ